jgi:hypothetical protein
MLGLLSGASLWPPFQDSVRGPAASRLEGSGKKLACSPLSIVEWLPRPTARDKPDVTSVPRELHAQVGIVGGNAANLIEHLRRKKRIVYGTQQQRWETDLFDPS